MPIEKIKLEFNETDLKELIALKYNLKLDKTILYVSHYQGDAREPSYTTIIVESEKINPLK